MIKYVQRDVQGDISAVYTLPQESLELEEMPHDSQELIYFFEDHKDDA